MTNERVAACSQKSTPVSSVRVSSTVQNALSSAGALDGAPHTFMEQHPGHNFSQFHVHPRSPASLIVQPKLRLNRPDDPYEHEADRISDQITQTPRPDPVNPERQLAASVQGRVTGDHAGLEEAPPLVEDVLRSSGQPLDRFTREFFQSRLGHQFGGVRVHSDTRAAESAQGINALAYTVGRDIVFGNGKYAPSTQAGRQLLAHELTHVIQQGGTQGVPSVQPKLIQRSLDTYLKAMNQKPRDWYTAAKHLNGEPPKVIRQMLKNLGDPKLIAELHKAAVNGPGVGPCSNIAMLTEPDYLKVNPTEKPFDRTKCAPASESRKAPEKTVDIQVFSQDKELVETLPEYIDGKVYAVGVRLMDSTYHLFIQGREKPLTIPSAWFGAQTEPVSTKYVYASREKALEVIGSNAKGYAYWRTSEDYILPSHFTPSSAPRINALALGSLEEAAKYGKEIFSNILIGMVAGKTVELAFRGAGYVVSKSLRRLESPPPKIEAGTKPPPTKTPAQAPKGGQAADEGGAKVIPIEEGQRIRQRKAAAANEVVEEPAMDLASGDRARASSGSGKKGGGKVVSGGDMESDVATTPKGGSANIPPEKPPVNVDARVRGVAIENRHLSSMPEYTPAKEHNFPGIEAWKGGKEVTRTTKSGKVRSIYGADVIQIKSLGNSNPKTIQARAQEGIKGLEPDIYATGNTRIVNPKGRRLDMVFDEGALTDLTPALRKQMTDLSQSAGNQGIEMRWYRYSADTKIRIEIP